jgi:lysophospholipase L1-like esterase
MGSNIYFGSNYSSLYQPAIILKKIVIYRQALTPTQIATVNAAMSGNWESLIDTRPRILTVGDSITQGTGETNSWGWRQGLQTALGVSVTWSPTSNYRLYGNYNFVGPYRTPSKDDFYQVNHAGVSGQRVDQMYDRLPTHLRNFMTGAPAGSIVLIHAGTNDVTSGTTATALTDIPLMIDQIYAFNPSIKIYVALIIPRTDANDAATTTYNTSLRSALVTKQTTVPTLHIVDMNTAFKANANWAADYLPAGSPWLYVHPNDAGYAVMTNTWASCIASSTNTYCDGH